MPGVLAGENLHARLRSTAMELTDMSLLYPSYEIGMEFSSSKEFYLDPLRLLQGLQSICKFSRTVRPPSRQGTM